MNCTPFTTEPRAALVPRDYQVKDHDECFRLWDAGERGVLTRIFTGGGKTPVSCMKMRTWLDRGPDHHCLVISYERDLVGQFAQEIADFLGIEPGIEMGEERVPEGEVPRVVVACRQSLLPVKLITADQARDLAEHGILDVNWLPRWRGERALAALANGADEDEVRAFLESLRGRYGADAPWSRLHKFDWRKTWLTFFDEAHRHAHSLKSVGHIVDWFDRNPASRRSGLTATPKRGDGISIGHKMFPGVAIDYPLFHIERPCAVKQGWAVPYVQKYIEVEGVDFKNLRRVKGDFDEAELELVLGEEATLAKLVQPLLDLVGDRRTLIFSPGVEMAKNVAAFINARVEAECPGCGARRWYPRRLVGDGARCACGGLIDPGGVTKPDEQARSINGTTPPLDRKKTYREHQAGYFQFLSVCGLCREGYNDPDVSCVAVFRPVSKKASSLAEQMKGRGCRPCRSVVPVLNELLTPEERVEAIAKSEKPNCLIVDLVGITGLADCALTLQIYADGLDDEVAALAEKILEEEAKDGTADVEGAIEKAQEQVAAEREAEERRRREAAERRARAQAEVRYTEHEVGLGSNVDPDRATTGQYKLIRLLGMDIKAPISRRRAGRIIGQLKQRLPAEEVARVNRVADWEPSGPTDNQLWCLGRLGVPAGLCRSGWDASQVIGASKDPGEFEQRKMAEIHGAADHGTLTGIAKDVLLARRMLPADVYQRLLEAGRAKRAALVE
jgi:superfamily II DNA or RNA helicase